MAQWDPSEQLERLGRRQTWAREAGRTFAKRLRSRRIEIEMPQQHVALTMALIYGHSSWQQTTVAKVEAGDREVKLSEAVALAEIVGCSLNELLGAPDGEHPKET